MTAESMPLVRGNTPPPQGAVIVGRYALYSEFASGGMAAVHFGRLLGAAGFARTVAVKRLHPQFAKDPEFVSMFVDEARMAARIRHPNVVQTLDVVQVAHEIFLVMDYVHGDSLANLLKKAHARGLKVPLRVATKIIQHALFGLHAAHDAKSERGEPLELVHRDMSPHNVLVGVDGVARVLDFGIAKAGGRVQVTRDGQVKGKLSYFAPEQLSSDQPIDRRADIYAASATLWETMTGRRLVQGDSDWQRVTQICAGELVPPSSVEPSLPKIFDQIVMKGLAKNPADRYATAREMAHALDAIGPHASAREVGEWVEEIGGESLRRRAEHVAAIESQSVSIVPPLVAEEPTLTRSDPGIIVSESSANRHSAPAAMMRSMSAPPSSPRVSTPSLNGNDSSMRGYIPGTVRPSSIDVPPRSSRRGWLTVPLLFLIVGAAFVFYMRDVRRTEEAAAAAAQAAAAAPGHPLASPPVASPQANIPPPPAADSIPANGSGPSDLAAGAAGAPATSPTSFGANSAANAAPTTTARAAWKPWKPWQPAQPAQAAQPTQAGQPSQVAQGSQAGQGSSPAAPAASPAAQDCEVPYTIDSQGFRHPKPQCL